MARSILEAFPELGDGDAVSTSMGAGGEDVRMSPAARARVPLSIECKNVEKINVWAAPRAGDGERASGRVAVPRVFTRNRAPVWPPCTGTCCAGGSARRVHAGGSSTTSSIVASARSSPSSRAASTGRDADAVDADDADAVDADARTGGDSSAVDCA